LSLLLEHEFALAILDVQMPGMNGFELAELMRGTEKTKHIPIVFVTPPGAR
jgi:CheY-like chemotaxis protein